MPPANTGKHLVTVSAGDPAAADRCTGSVVIRLLRSPLTWVAIAALGVGAALGLYWFQPWKLVTDRTVTETLSSPAPAAAGSGTGRLVVRADDRERRRVRHARARHLGQCPDRPGRRRSHTLEIVGLDTSNGPDLRVWLTDQPVRAGVAGWRVFDDGEWVELGRLKGNKGDQAYALPADLDPSAYRSVAIWCKRFAVSFGAAPLAG